MIAGKNLSFFLKKKKGERKKQKNSSPPSVPIGNDRAKIWQYRQSQASHTLIAEDAADEVDASANQIASGIVSGYNVAGKVANLSNVRWAVIIAIAVGAIVLWWWWWRGNLLSGWRIVDKKILVSSGNLLDNGSLLGWWGGEVLGAELIAIHGGKCVGLDVERLQVLRVAEELGDLRDDLNEFVELAEDIRVAGGDYVAYGQC